MSEIARRRIAAALLVAGIVVAVLAIADLGPFEDTAPTEQDEVATTVVRLYDAAAEGNSREFCSLLAPRARMTLRENAAQLTGEAEIACARAVELTLGDALEGASVTIEETSVSGPRARVMANLRTPDERPELLTVRLEELEGEWLVSDPG